MVDLIKVNKKPSRRQGFTKPTFAPGVKEKKKYDQERKKREKCRASNPSVEFCSHCSMEEICPTEATEDWINREKVENGRPQDPNLAA